jgi:hypothetical protein
MIVAKLLYSAICVLVPRELRSEGLAPFPLPLDSIVVIPVTPHSSIADTTRFSLFDGMIASMRFMAF